MKPVCYLDMDEVICDFVSGALTAHGSNRPRSTLSWGLAVDLGFEGREEEFWGIFGQSFWRELDWTYEGRDVLGACERIFGEDNVCLVTSPCRTPGCPDGKLEWIAKHIPRYSRKCVMAPCKHLLAGPSKVLVDDHQVNIDKFIEHGGIGVLAPRPWNRLKEKTNKDGNFDVPKLVEEIKLAHRVASEDHYYQTLIIKDLMSQSATRNTTKARRNATPAYSLNYLTSEGKTQTKRFPDQATAKAFKQGLVIGGMKNVGRITPLTSTPFGTGSL